MSANNFLVLRQSFPFVEIPDDIHYKIVEEREFEDGEPDFKIPGLHLFTGKNVVFIADWSCPKQRYLDMVCLWPIAEMQPALLTIVVPFFPSATMEREVFAGSVATANVDAKLLSTLECSKKVVTLDLHTLQNQFYFQKTCVSMLSCAKAFVPRIFLLDTVLVFPDDGALKRFVPLFPHSAKTHCSKKRIANTRIVTLEDNGRRMVKGKHVIIVDDLVRTGGTLLECVKAVQSAGADEVDIFVTHSVFPKDEFKKFVSPSSVFKGTFYTTDTVRKTSEKMAKYSSRFKIFNFFKMLCEEKIIQQ